MGTHDLSAILVQRSSGRRVRWVLVGFGLAMVVLALVSRGVYMNDDLLHLQIARSVWVDPLLMLDEWGRPGFTIPYAGVGAIADPEMAFLAGRLLSVALTLATAWITYRIARKLSIPAPWTAAALLLLMPLYFSVSYTTTTETIAAFYVATGTLLFLHRRWALAAIVLAILPTTRHELIALVAGVGVFFLLRRQVVAALLLLWAEFAWNVAVAIIGPKRIPPRRLPIGRFITTSDSGILGEGTWTHYITRWLELSGTTIVWLACCGVLIILMRLAMRWGVWRSILRPNLRRDVWLVITLGTVGLLMMFTVLYAINRFSSGGYARFLIPVAPWMACLASLGLFVLMRMLARREWVGTDRAKAAIMLPLLSVSVFQHRLDLGVYHATIFGLALIAILARSRRMWVTLLLLALVAEFGFRARPHFLTEHDLRIRAIVMEMRERFPEHRLHGSTPWVEFYAGEPMWRHELPWPWTPRDPVKMLFIFETIHGKPKTLQLLTGEIWNGDYAAPVVAEYAHPWVRVFERPIKRPIKREPDE